MSPGEVAQRLPARNWRNLDRNERTKGDETPPQEPGAGTTSGKTGENEHRIDTETQQSDGAYSALSAILRGISGRLYGRFFLENRPEKRHENLLSVYCGCYG